VGNFPPLWTEWNGKYRDTVRDFWRGEPSALGEFASRIAGSSDLYQDDGRHPIASINFVTAHDGFTLRDLVSYNDKHNQANGEENRDGESHNRSWNCGAEGSTDAEDVLTLRAQQQRNFLATLLMSQGVPMLSHGDEIGRSQRGNNNVYCQDNDLSWLHWDLSEENERLLEFTRQLVRLRHEHPVFRRRRFFKGEALHGGESEIGDIAWFTPSGTSMTHEDWMNGQARTITVFLNGQRLLEPDRRGQRVVDDSFLVVFNAHYENLDVTTPPVEYGSWWTVLIDTAEDDGTGAETGDVVGPSTRIAVAARSLLVLFRPREDDPAPPPATEAVSRSAETVPGDGSGSSGSSLPRPTPARRTDS
jgi:glycogen operon protein